MVNPISFPMPQAFSGGVDFSPLANLGNVYNQAQERGLQQQALSQLGNDPVANAQMLIKSGVPSLAELGMKMQQQQATAAEQQREFGLQQGLREALNQRQAAAEERAKKDWEKNSPEGRAADVVAAGGDPNSPEWRPYVSTGANPPDPNKIAKMQELSASETKLLGAHHDSEVAALDTIDNLKKMLDFAEKGDIYEGMGAGKRAAAMTAINPFVPGFDLPGEKRAENTEVFQNLANQNIATMTRATFPGRTLKSELSLMSQIESTPNMPNTQKATILRQLITKMENHAADAHSIQEAIRNKTYLRPGYQPPDRASSTGATAPKADPLGIR